LNSIFAAKISIFFQKAMNFKLNIHVLSAFFEKVPYSIADSFY